jgi:erythromycin esterase-like protein
MEFAGAAETGLDDTGPDPAAASKACGEVVARLEANRAAYVKTTSEATADWAIQNARVVHQCLRLAADETPRDESMATNVKWILDHAPAGAKIVLWAHNGHVGRQTHRGGAMGAFLDTWYAKDQVVIGFAAGEGRYTAIVEGKGLRSDNRLTPPVTNSYEQYFRASGLPRFILGLRRTGRDDPASEWLTRHHAFRSIGALAMDNQFFSTDLSGLFDAIIDLDTTTASRSLPGAGANRLNR